MLTMETEHCRVFREALEDEVSPGKVRINRSSDGCVVDVTNDVTVEASSIWIDRNGNASGELLVPHCQNKSGTSDMFLITEAMEICSPRCRISQVHVHPFIAPDEAGKRNAVGSTHIHLTCVEDKHTSTSHCLRLLAKTIGKLDRYISKTCLGKKEKELWRPQNDI